MASLIDRVPRHLLDELVEGSWLPIVGAGFSRNSIVERGLPPASWLELGAELGRDIEGVDSISGTLEAISAFEHAFGRVALVDRTASLIRAHDALPGSAHLAFARVGFTNVVTTNFDLLLERAYERVGKACLPIVDETQLSTPNRYAGPRVIKFHGDINHPIRMVITEEDYDQFPHAFPLLTTSVTAMLVERTGILVGYSLDDPDTRQILALIKRRLGRMARPLWTIQVGAAAHVVSRYERRGVKVINLPVVRGRSIGDQLAAFFTELAQYWRERLPVNSVATDDRVAADFRVPQEQSRLCYFAIPAELIGWYREVIFPEVEAIGLIPVTARDVFSPPGTTSTKLDALINRAAFVVAELGDLTSEYEFASASAQRSEKRVLLIVPDSLQVSRPEMFDQIYLVRPARFEVSPDDFITAFRGWLSSVAWPAKRKSAEPERLLARREYESALISAVSLLEVTLSERLAASPRGSSRPLSLRAMLVAADQHGLFDSDQEKRAIEEAVSRRNQAIHTTVVVSPSDAKRLVKVIRQFVQRTTQLM